MKRFMIAVLIASTTLAHADITPTATAVSVSEVAKPKNDFWNWTWLGTWALTGIVFGCIAASSPHQSYN